MTNLYHKNYIRTITTRLILFLLVVSAVATAVAAEVHTTVHGLHFNSFNESQGKRTSLSLNDGQPFGLSRELKLQFDFVLRDGGVYYGDILNIQPNAGSPVRLAILFEDGSPQLVLIQDNKITRVTAFPVNKWQTVGLSIDTESNNIEVSMDSASRKIPLSLNNSTEAKVSFGFLNKISRDVPSMSLSNIKVWEDGELTRNWLLNKHDDSVCYDEVAHSAAEATDGIWLIDAHSRFTPIFSKEYPSPVDLAVDTRNGIFSVVDGQQIENYDVYGKKLSVVPVSGNSPRLVVGNAFVSPLDGNLQIYAIENEAVSAFDPASRSWQNPEATQVEDVSYNHARAWNPADSSYYFFGGYGHYRYSNELVRLDMRTRQWSNVDYEPLLPPRYGAAAVIHDNNLYILGGRGNKEGRQEITTHSYYTLNRIDLSTGKQEQLWAMSDTLVDTPRMFLSSTMVYNEADNSLYAVCMGDGITLMKFSLKEPGWTDVYQFGLGEDAFELCDLTLYNCPEQNRVLLAINKINTNKTATVHVFSLVAPILTMEDIRQSDSEPASSSQAAKILLWCAVGLIIIGGGIWFYVRRNRGPRTPEPAVEPLQPVVPDKNSEQNKVKESVAEQPAEQPSELAVTTAAVSEAKESDYKLLLPKVQHKSFIQLLGDFRVFDREGRDITVQCTPKLRELLLVIIFNCERERSGHFPAERISDQLWPDKDGLAARNNRNVSLRKLRSYLEEVGDIDISGNNSVISINWNNVICDYHEVMQAAKQLEADRNSARVITQAMFEDDSPLAYLLSGTLLPDNNDPWLDEFKAKFSSLSLDYLEDLLSEEMKRNHGDNVLNIAAVMLKHDPFNESALAARCRVLVKYNKRGLAKNIYQSFCRKYEEAMNEPFKYTFADILGSDNKGWNPFR